MNTLIKILLVIIILREARSRTVLVPLDLGTWRPTDVDRLDCPMHGDLSNQGTKAIELEYHTAAWGLKNSISGSLCVTAKWSITCDYRWYGSKYISTMIEYLPTTPEMCRESKRELDRGELLAPHFPTENCGWNNVLTESKEFTTLVPHSVKLDAYSLILLDNLFEGGRCQAKECPIVMHQGMWIANQEAFGFCKELVRHRGLLFMTGLKNSLGDIVRQEWNLNSVFQPEIGREKHFNGACKMSYCGNPGVRFSDREWFQLGVPSEEGIKNVINNLKNCGEDNLIHSHDTNTDIKELTEHVDEVALNAICLQEVRRARDTKTVSDWLLSMMSPFSEGIGFVYRINKGTLESTVGFYRKVVLEGDGTPERLGVGLDKKPISWDQFVTKTNDTRIQSMFNGNTVVNGKIKWVKNVLGAHILDEISALEFDVPIIQHPHLDVLKFNDSQIVSSHHPNGKGVNFVESVTHWAGGLWESIGSSAVLIVAIIICALIVYKCLSVFFLKRRPSPPETSENVFMLRTV
ncbi:glycoprotein [Leman virus]|uniref:Glycoprotein n=1 Tax=Leman virus TaxID=3071226 RepID=A0AAE7CAP8_9RHAB|nr:glycoprotein [Perhabdovirus perca]QIQ19248.1 glycoprotein [Leman virus]